MSFQHFLLPVMDPSVKHWDDTEGATCIFLAQITMFIQLCVSYLNDKKESTLMTPFYPNSFIDDIKDCTIMKV